MGPVSQVTWLFLAFEDARQPRVKAIDLLLEHILKDDCGPGAILGTEGAWRVRDNVPCPHEAHRRPKTAKQVAAMRHNGAWSCTSNTPLESFRMTDSCQLFTTTTEISLRTGHKQACFLKANVQLESRIPVV